MDIAVTNNKAYVEKRFRKRPVPVPLYRYLSGLQKTTINDLETLGWKIWFVRRNFFKPVTPVLIDPQNKFAVIVKQNGLVQYHHGLHFRPD